MTETTSRTQCVLVIDDDEPVQRLISRALEREGYRVVPVGSASSALQALSDDDFDLLILDLLLPDADGLDTLTQIRETHDVPTIIVSGRGAEGDRVLGLTSGADDYVVKPFSPRELVARVQAVLRRTVPGEPIDVLEFGEMELDRKAHAVRRQGRTVPLTPQEYALFETLAQRAGRACSREELLRWAWGSSVEFQDPATVTEHVRRLRSKLEVDPARPRHLITVRGVGYRLDP